MNLKTGATPDNTPFDNPAYHERGGQIAYAKGDCPVADDLFNRNISIPLDQWYSPEDCRNIARGVNKVLSAYCTADAGATPWLQFQ